MVIIGESLNASIPSVGQAVVSRNKDSIGTLSRFQAECGAHMLDVNAGGLAGRDEEEDLVWMVKVVQEFVEVPLVLDSHNPRALMATLRAGVAIAGHDEWCREYFKAYRSGKLEDN